MRRDKTNYIAVHCSATKPSQDIGVDEIRDWHVNGNGWSDVGYHAVIRQNGRIEFGRHFDDVGAGVRGYNNESVHIALVGGLNEVGEPANTFNDDQMFALSMLIEVLLDAYPGAKVQGHRDFPDVKKECPCFDVKEFFDEERSHR